MKQLTIFCSEELTGQVNQALHRAQVDDYIHMPGIYGNKLKTRGSFEKDQTYPATAFIILAASGRIESIVKDLQEYANQCDVKPCLRMTVIIPEQTY